MKSKNSFRIASAVMVCLLLSTVSLSQNSWQMISNIGPERSGMGFTYDSQRNRLILFGGNFGTSIMRDTWEWNGTDWNKVDSTTGPSNRQSLQMCYDEARGNILLFGGWTTPDNYFDDTWTWDGSNWIQHFVSGPSARANHTMAYDNDRQRIVLFGGSYYQSIYHDTWEWNGTQWELVSNTGPSERIYPSMVYDDNAQKCLLFGGITTYFGQCLHDTWLWDGTTWTLVDTTGPSARIGHMMAYDPIINRTILFGGANAWSNPTAFFNDTWEWNGSNWTQNLSLGPSGRSGGRMTFHDNLGRAVLFGGVDSSGFKSDLWKYGSFVAVEPSHQKPSPSSFTLHPCHPNPFNPSAIISYELRAVSNVILKVYDTTGQRVSMLVNERQSVGTHVAIFDGFGLASGIYVAHLQVGEFAATQKLVLLR